jgi:hypothetical protein
MKYNENATMAVVRNDRRKPRVLIMAPVAKHHINPPTPLPAEAMPPDTVCEGSPLREPLGHDSRSSDVLETAAPSKKCPLGKVKMPNSSCEAC